jgi:hypothetical protein
VSLFALPVSVSDLTTLQSGIEFFTNTGEATTEVAAINADGSKETVATYVAGLIQKNISLSQVAMAVDSLMFGATDSITELTKLSTQFLPAQVATAIANDFNPTVYASEALGLALAGGNGTSNEFATHFGSMSESAFAQAVATATGVNADAIQQFVTNWINFYTANPAATGGLSLTLASYGAAFGDAVGVALLNSTAANLQALVSNALIDNAEGSYAAGVQIGALPAHQLLQGEGSTPNVLDLTVNGDVTVDMAKEPATIDTILYQPTASGSVTINDQTNPLTVNLQDTTDHTQTLSVGAVGPAPGLNDSLTVVMGTPSNGDSIGAMNVMGDELFTLTALGPPGGLTDQTGLITLTPTLGGNEHVTISGNSGLGIGFSPELIPQQGSPPTVGFEGAIADATAGVLNVNNLTITITNTGETGFLPDSVPGTLLNFVSSAGPAPSIPYSTNAVLIDASTSGGLLMLAGDANFVPASSAGDVITGAANPVGVNGITAGNFLGGSIGNDIITSKSITLPDFIFTDGGADTITLAPGHTGADQVAFYAVGLVGAEGGGSVVMPSVANAIAEPVLDNLQFVNPGWWGVGAGDTPKDILGLNFNGTGTSVDNSTLNGFVPGQDFLDFSVSAWGGPSFPVNGLTADTGAALVNISTVTGLSSDTGVSVNAVAVAPGGSIFGSAATPTDLIVLAQNSFLDANAVATVLANGTYTINHAIAALNTDYDFLLAYQGLDGNAHIADLHILGGNNTGNTIKDSVVGVSDIVTLVGVTLPQLLANDSHIHIVT